MTDPAVLAFVTGALPERPARVLEVGAGSGELAAALRELGHDVLAIDPAASSPDVVPVRLHELDEPEGSFDAAVAVVSMHHVDPLAESCERLATLVRPGGRLVVDEFAVELLDERAARWWTEQREAATREPQKQPEALIEMMRDHLHPLERMLEELSRGFALGGVEWGAYLYRWHLDEALREPEERLIAADLLPATGVRFTGRRT